MISTVCPIQTYQELCQTDIDHLILPRKEGFPQCDCDCNPDKKRVELERLRSQTQNKQLEDSLKEIEALQNIVDEKKRQERELKEKVSKAEDREADISFRLAELERRLQVITRNFSRGGSLRSSIYKRRSMQFVNGSTIEPLPEESPPALETKTKLSRRKISNDPNFELKISSRDRTLEALEHMLRDSFRHLAELQL